MTTKTKSMYKYLKIGSHLGKKFVNPDMENYHMGVRNNIAIVEIQATLLSFYRSLYVIKKVIDSKGNILFLNTSSELSSLVKKVANKIQSNLSIQVVRPIPGDGPAFLSSLLARQSSTLRLRHNNNRRGASYCGAAHFAVPATRLINVLGGEVRQNSWRFYNAQKIGSRSDLNCKQYISTILPLQKVYKVNNRSSTRARHCFQQRGDKYRTIVPRYTQVPTVARRLGSSYWHIRVPAPSFIAPSKGRPTMMRSCNRERSELDLDPKAYGVSTDCKKSATLLRRIEKGRACAHPLVLAHKCASTLSAQLSQRHASATHLGPSDKYKRASRLREAHGVPKGPAPLCLHTIGDEVTGSPPSVFFLRTEPPSGTPVLASRLTSSTQPQVARHSGCCRVTSNLHQPCALRVPSGPRHFDTPSRVLALDAHTYAQPLKKPFSVHNGPLGVALAPPRARSVVQHSMRVCRVYAAPRPLIFVDQPSNTKVDNAQSLTSESDLPFNMNIGYCNDKWSGGTLTNWKQISQSVAIFAKFYKYTSQFNSTSRYRRVYYADFLSSAYPYAAISLRHYLFKVVQTKKNGGDPTVGKRRAPREGRVLTTSKLQQKHRIPAADTSINQNSRYIKMTKCFRGLIILNKMIKQTQFYRIQAILNNYPCCFAAPICLHTSVQAPDPSGWLSHPKRFAGYAVHYAHKWSEAVKAGAKHQAAHSTIGACITTRRQPHHEPKAIGLRPITKSSHGRIVLANLEQPRLLSTRPADPMVLRTTTRLNGKASHHVLILKWRLLGRKTGEIARKFYQYIPTHRQSSVGRALFCQAFGVSTHISRTHSRVLSDVHIYRPSLRRTSFGEADPVTYEVQLCFNSIGDLCHHTDERYPLGDWSRRDQVTLNPRDRPLGHRKIPGGNTPTFGQVHPCHLLIVLNPNENKVAIREARSLGLPVLSFVDSNTKLMGITYPVIGNVGSLRFIHLYMSWILKLIRHRMSRIPRRSRPDYTQTSVRVSSYNTTLFKASRNTNFVTDLFR